jgi:hypothetical protein
MTGRSLGPLAFRITRQSDRAAICTELEDLCAGVALRHAVALRDDPLVPRHASTRLIVLRGHAGQKPDVRATRERAFCRPLPASGSA